MSWAKPILYREKTWCLMLIYANLTVAAITVGFNLLATIMVLNQIQGELSVGHAAAMWIGRSVLVMQALSPPLPLKAANRFGYKKVLFGGILLFTLSALGCAFAVNYWAMLICRLLTGVGQAIIFGLGLARVVQHMPDKWGVIATSGYASLSMGLGIGLGIIIGGWFGQMEHWRWVFWVQVWVGLVNLIMMLLFHPESEQIECRPFDFLGYLTFCLGVGGALLVVTQAKAGWNTLGFRSEFAIFWTIVAAASLLIFVIRAATAKSPLFVRTYFREPSFIIGCIGMFIVGTMVFGITVVSIQMLEEVFQYEKMRIGYILAPVGLAYLVCGLIPMLLRRWVPQEWWAVPAIGFIALSCWMSQWVTIQSPQVQLGLIIIVRAVGVGLAIGPVMVMSLAHFPKEAAQRGALIVNTVRMLGATFGSSVVGMVVQLRWPLHFDRFSSQMNLHSPAYEEWAESLQTVMTPDQTEGYIMGRVIEQARLAGLIDAIYIFGWALLGVLILVTGLLIWERIRLRKRVALA